VPIIIATAIIDVKLALNRVKDQRHFPRGAPPSALGPPVSSSFAAMFFHAGPRAGLGAKTTRSACATPRSNTFWRFPLKLPSVRLRPG